MRDISEELTAIEEASRGEEVRDSIVSALTAMEDGINYVAVESVTVDSATADSTVYSGGYKYEVAKTGITATTLAIPVLTDLESYVGRYAVVTSADLFTLYFDTQPDADLSMKIYYFVDNYGDAEVTEF